MIMVALSLITLFGFVGFVVDIGRVMNARRQLQASSDVAAQAGAAAIDISKPINDAANSVTAVNQAYDFASDQGKGAHKNAYPNLSNVTASATVVCTDSISQTISGQDCSATNQANTMVVTQSATLNTFFAVLLGRTSFTINTVAKSASRSGGLPPLDVQVVMDASCSMNNVDPDTGNLRIDDAKAAVAQMMQQLQPCPTGLTCLSTNAIDKVGLSVFPAVDSGSAYKMFQSDTMASDDFIAYDQVDMSQAGSGYQIEPLNYNYRPSSGSALNYGARLAKATLATSSGIKAHPINGYWHGESRHNGDCRNGDWGGWNGGGGGWGGWGEGGGNNWGGWGGGFALNGASGIGGLQAVFNLFADGPDVVQPASMAMALDGGDWNGNHGGSMYGSDTYIADAIYDASNRLTWAKNSRTRSAHSVVIVLSDGNAGASRDAVCDPSDWSCLNTKYDSQCQQAIDASTAVSDPSLAPNDAWVYSIAYDSSTTKGYTHSDYSGYGSCRTDHGRLSACDTMKGIASANGMNDPSKFYSTGGSCTSSAHPSFQDLNSIFTAITRDLQRARLIQ
jgi:Flp pilus assembly protein TadG